MSTPQARISIIAMATLALIPSGMASESIIQLGTPGSLQSQVLSQEMSLSLHLPQGYDQGSERYPVIIMMGSEFRERFALWASTLDYMSGQGQIPKMILVGVDLSQGNGVLLPDRQTGSTESTDKHLRFINDELIPFVDAEYRTVPYRVLFGASNSGFFAVYALLQEPNSFNAFLSSSPMLSWAEDLLTQKAEALKQKTELRPSFLSVIYSDDDYEQVTQSIPKFMDTLKAQGLPWLTLNDEIKSNQGHVPASDINGHLNALFPDFNPKASLEFLDAARAHYEAISKRYGFSIPVPSDRLFDMGIQQIIAKNLTEARKTFEYAVKTYPHQGRSYVGIGLVERDEGNKEQAMAHFNKALVIDPDDSLAKRLLDRLQNPEP